MSPVHDEFTVWAKRLADPLDDGELPASTLTTYITAADLFDIPHERIGEVVSFLNNLPSYPDLPAHRIVSNRGFLAAGYPGRCVELLRAEGWTIITAKSGNRRVAGFRDHWARGLPSATKA